MTVNELIEKTGFTPAVLPVPELEIEGCYAGDLLSWVMGNACHGCAWVTIMTNRNIMAVASLIEMACIILAEGCEPSEELRQDILNYCKKHIAKYAMPYTIEFRSELPKTLVGKIAYTVLEKEANADLAKELVS